MSASVSNDVSKEWQGMVDDISLPVTFSADDVFDLLYTGVKSTAPDQPSSIYLDPLRGIGANSAHGEGGLNLGFLIEESLHSRVKSGTLDEEVYERAENISQSAMRGTFSESIEELLEQNVEGSNRAPEEQIQAIKKDFIALDEVWQSFKGLGNLYEHAVYGAHGSSTDKSAIKLFSSEVSFDDVVDYAESNFDWQGAIEDFMHDYSEFLRTRFNHELSELENSDLDPTKYVLHPFPQTAYNFFSSPRPKLILPGQGNIIRSYKPDKEYTEPLSKIGKDAWAVAVNKDEENIDSEILGHQTLFRGEDRPYIRIEVYRKEFM